MRNSSGRLILMLPIATVVTAGLFLVMGGLIQNDYIVTGEVVEPPTFSITPTTEETTPQPPLRVEPFEKTPPPEQPRPNEWKPASPEGFTIPAPTPASGPDGPGGTGTFQPGAEIPAYPMYPEKCRSRGLEGSATVRFDVNERGEALNIQVVSSSHSCFDREAIRAIQKSKFSPGKARSGQTRTFRFDLEE